MIASNNSGRSSNTNWLTLRGMSVIFSMFLYQPLDFFSLFVFVLHLTGFVITQLILGHPLRLKHHH